MTDERLEKTVKWLKRAKKAEESAEYWLSRLKHDKELAYGNVKNFNDSGTYGKSSGNSTENALVNLAETERKVQEKLRELAEIRSEIAGAIEKIEGEDLQAVLAWHYLKFLTWEETACKMNYSVSSVYFKRRKALEKLCSILY